ncbi:phage major capsid protein, partial [Enterobacter hormaechei]
MKVTQRYALVNSVTKDVLGDSAVVNEDLSNVVDIGKAIMDTTNGIDNYVRKLVDHIGKVIFVNRVYAGGA